MIACMFLGNKAIAQKVNTAALKATIALKSKGSNPKIIVDIPTTDAHPVPKSRGTTTTINFDNYTGLFVKMYVDGNYKGTIDAWGKATITVKSGYTSVYLVSVGGTREWNASPGNTSAVWNYTLR